MHGTAELHLPLNESGLASERFASPVEHTSQSSVIAALLL